MQKGLTSLISAFALAAASIPASFGHGQADPHAGHQMMSQTVRSTADYVIPDVALVRADGGTAVLNDELSDGRPIVLNFIYTTCTTVCPLSSQTFSELQTRLGSRRNAVHLVSISIDPEHDTPARLSQYAKQFGAGPSWNFYTGTRAASITAQRAFNVYRGDKMDHAPVTLVRTATSKAWVRLDGFATPDQLLAELRDTVASHDHGAAARLVRAP